MKLPRNVSGATLQASLRRLGYDAVRQRGSHVRITTQINGEHHEVIPLHTPIRAKTLSSILKSVARHHEMTRCPRIGMSGIWGGSGRFFKGGGGTKEDETEDGIPCVRYGDLYTHHRFFITAKPGMRRT